jgi:hypothetical protein
MHVLRTTTASSLVDYLLFRTAAMLLTFMLVNLTSLSLTTVALFFYSNHIDSYIYGRSSDGYLHWDDNRETQLDKGTSSHVIALLNYRA